MRAASELSSTPRRSGRHVAGADGASATDEDSMERAMHRTASRNLDFDGTSSCKSFLSFDKAKMSSNIASLGISLGKNDSVVYFSVKALKQMEFDRLTVAPRTLHLVNDSIEVDFEDTMRDTMLCELVASVRKNKSNSGSKKGRPKKKTKVSKRNKVSP